MMPTAADPYALHWSMYPRHYIAPRVSKPLVIDGNIEKPEWQAVPFSEPFDEIRGKEDAPDGTHPPESCQTRMKMMWDDDFLYICALIESDFTVTANFTKRNEPIFQKDSDFEVFLDPPGSCHMYKEFEMNAINTVWNLMLDKPYDDDGHEHSARIAGPGKEDYYEVYAQKTAAKVVKGTIGDPKGATWAVELAFAHSDTISKNPLATRLPRQGDRWRINFSRVEHEGDTNWTWQAQRVWDPEKKRVTGKVAMHLPDSWGYVEFGSPFDEGSKSTFQGEVSVKDALATKRCDPAWPARLTVMNIYYAQRRYAQLNSGHYAPDVASLIELDLVDPDILHPFMDSQDSNAIIINTSDGGKTYKASVVDLVNRLRATVTDERLLTVERIGNEISSSVS